MPVKTVVFDFDGTLADSNSLKYEAYFRIMPEKYEHVIRQVLDTMFEASRYEIIAEILRRVPEDGKAFEGVGADRVQELSKRYNDIVLQGACDCAAIPGAVEMLELLQERDIPSYVSSTTPQEFLRKIVERRGWNHFFRGVFGFPATKEDTLERIVQDEGVLPEEILVVGDGESDRRSAEALHAMFVPVTDGRFPVQEVRRLLGP